VREIGKRLAFGLKDTRRKKGIQIPVKQKININSFVAEANDQNDTNKCFVLLITAFKRNLSFGSNKI